MDEQGDLERSIEQTGAALRERRGLALVALDPDDRKRLGREIEQIQRNLFELRKRYDALTETQRPQQSSTASEGNVFISYSRKDRKWLKPLLAALKPAVPEARLETWDDARISPGASWRSMLQEAIERSRVVILLLSIDYFASDILFENELPLILDRAKRSEVKLLIVVVGPCLSAWENSGLDLYQAVNSPSNPLNGISPLEQRRTFENVARLLKRYLADAVATA